MNMIDARRLPNLHQLTFTFVPFAIMLVGGLFLSLAEPAVDYARSQFTIWASLVLTTPALCLFAVAWRRTPHSRWWRLYWTFGYLAYLAHFYYAFGKLFGWDFAAVYAGQGTVVAVANFTLTGLWGIDVLLAWVSRRSGGAIAWYRLLVHVLVLASFITASVVFREFGATVWWLGVLMGVGVVGAIVVRLLQGSATES